LMGVGGYIPRPIPRTDADGRPMGYWHADEVVQRHPPSGTARVESHEHLSEVREPYLRKLARQVGLDYLHLGNLDSVRVAMLNPRFAERKLTPTDFRWVAGTLALLTLVLGSLNDIRAGTKATRPPL
jgi:mxaL protein